MSSNKDLPEPTQRRRIRPHCVTCLRCMETSHIKLDTMDLPGGVSTLCPRCERVAVLVADPLHKDESRMLVCSNKTCSTGWTGKPRCGDCGCFATELDPIFGRGVRKKP